MGRKRYYVEVSYAVCSSSPFAAGKNRRFISERVSLTVFSVPACRNETDQQSICSGPRGVKNSIPFQRSRFGCCSCFHVVGRLPPRGGDPAAPGASEGEKLERQMAADIKAKNWKAVESRIADRFQSVHPDGSRDRAGEIALLKKMNFGDLR